MGTTWTEWAPADIRDAAETEGRTALDALAVPGLKLVETLPYYGAFADYRAHVTACASCRRDDRMDCAEGEGLLVVSRIGIEEQHILAASN